MNIPTYLSIKDYDKLKNIDLSTNAGVISAIKAIIDTTDEELKAMNAEELHKVSKALQAVAMKTQPKFWAVFAHNGVEYGFQPLSKMTLGEWIDLDNHLQDWKNNLHNIMAVCYRPIKKHTWKNPLWQAKYNIKLMMNKETSAFDTYQVEDYDISNKRARAESFLDMPIEIANGALAFFLAVGLKSINDTISSSEEIPTIEVMMGTIDSLYHNTMAG